MRRQRQFRTHISYVVERVDLYERDVGQLDLPCFYTVMAHFFVHSAKSCTMNKKEIVQVVEQCKMDKEIKFN